MRATRERQIWLGVLALLLAAPLPATGVVAWPFLIPYGVSALVLVMAQRPLRGVPNWAENLLAPLILAVVILAGGARFGILRPIAHLALLLAAVRLPVAARRGKASLSSLLLVLVGVAGVASSTHPALAVYLLLVLAVTVVAVGRWAGLEAEEAGASSGPARWPSARLVAATVVLAAVIAAPLFALFPRLRSPFAAAPGGSRSVSGFRESVTLANIGDIRASQRVAMRVRFPGAGLVEPQWLRLAGSTLNHYRGGLWVVGQRDTDDFDGPTGADLAAAGNALSAEVTVQVAGERLFLPVGTTGLLEPPEGVMVRPGPLGSRRISRNAPLPIRYSAEFLPGAVVQSPPTEADRTVPAFREELEHLAREVTAAAATDLDRSLLLERHLQEGYGYTTDLSLDSPLLGDPVAWFLFDGRRGHCEFFASAMVLLARSLDIPARLQVGYLGGEQDGSGGFLVRDANAHAWVVAFVDEAWRVFDPTPVLEQPGVLEASGLLGLWRRWLGVEQFWDRWVLTFSLADQVGIARWVMEHGPAIGRWFLRSMPWLLLVGLGLAVAVRFFRGRQLPWRGSDPSASEPVTRELRAVLQAARDGGWLAAGGVTPRQATAALVALDPGIDEPLRWLVGVHEARRYALGPAPSAAEVRRTARVLRRRLQELGREPGRPAGRRSTGSRR